MAVIEIQTIEGGRLEWVAIYRDSNPERAVEWGNRLVGNMETVKPSIRILDCLHGKVIGAWQTEGYTEEKN